MSSRQCPNTHSISERTIEKYLLQYIENALQEYIVEVEISSVINAHHPSDNTVQIRQKQERVKELFIDGAISLDEYKARVEALEKKIIHPVSQQKKPNLAQLKKLTETDFLKTYHLLSREEKRSVWRSILKELHTYRGTIQGPPIFI